MSTRDFLDYKHSPDRPTADGHESIKADDTWHQVSLDWSIEIHCDPSFLVFQILLCVMFASSFQRLSQFRIYSCLNEVVSRYAAVAQCPQSGSKAAKQSNCTLKFEFSNSRAKSWCFRSWLALRKSKRASFLDHILVDGATMRGRLFPYLTVVILIISRW